VRSLQPLIEIIALVIHDDEGWEILNLNPPNGFHAEFGIFQHFNLLDAVLREPRGGATNRT
jgi:hypothetical protein